MNERIRELAAKTGIYGAVDINGNYDNEAEVKKFAELIVGECADFVCNYPEKYLTYNQAREISLKMEEHFGVEL